MAHAMHPQQVVIVERLMLARLAIGGYARQRLINASAKKTYSCGSPGVPHLLARTAMRLQGKDRSLLGTAVLNAVKPSGDRYTA
jgi:hypothetical protein